MIIQILDTATKQWLDRCYCGTRQTAEREVERLEKIYRFNKFKIVPGKKKLPRPVYFDKTDDHIESIVSGIDRILKEPINDKYPAKMIKALQGKYKGDKNAKRKRIFKR